VVAVLLRWQLRRCTHRDHPPVHRTAADATLTAQRTPTASALSFPGLKAEACCAPGHRHEGQRPGGHAQWQVVATGRAGTPTAVQPGGRSFTTAAPAPTMQFAPMRVIGRTLTPTPRSQHEPTHAPPARCTPGPRLTKSPSSQSWLM